VLRCTGQGKEFGPAGLELHAGDRKHDMKF